MQKHFLAAAVLLAALTRAAAADVSGPVVASYGNWDVHRTAAAITGHGECIATYRGRERVELYNNMLILQSSSWRNPRAFRYRIDELPATGFMTASDLVRRSRTIGFDGDAFNRLLRARRLRVEVVNLHDVLEFDLDLNGIYNAYGAVYHCR
ncbi:MAG: hypothetical protein ACM3JG_01300 [Thiohalocapsa sp.]